MSHSYIQHYRFSIALFVGLYVISQPVCGADVSKAAPSTSAAGHTPYVIKGMIIDTTADLSIEGLFKFAHGAFDLESIREDNGKEYSKCLEAYLNPRTNRTDAVVMLEGNSIKRESRTSLDGYYRFENIPAGEYKISASAPALYVATGETRMAVGHTLAQIPPNPHFDITINAYLLSIKGRVLTSNGQPIAGAHVVGQPFAPKNWDNVSAGFREVGKGVSAFSDETGVYELQGFMPMSGFALAGYLMQTNLTLYIEVRAEAAGFMQATNRVPQIPPISPELIPPARRLMYFFLLNCGKEIYSPIHERDDLPAGDGNTITGIDIVMDRVDTTSPPSAEVPPSESN